MLEDKLKLILQYVDSLNNVVSLLLDDRISDINAQIRLAELNIKPSVELKTGEAINRLDWISEQEKERDRWVNAVNTANQRLMELKRALSL